MKTERIYHKKKVGATMSIQEILSLIQTNKWYYIAAFTVIPAAVTWIGNIILDRTRKVKGKGRRTVISAVIYLLTSFVSAALPILFPYTDIADSGGNFGSLNSYRFDMYDDQQIMTRVSDVNMDLGHDGKRVKPDDYKAFIYAMNGDYSLYVDQNDFLDTAVMFVNVDVDAVNILRSDYLTDDVVSPITSLADIFRDEYDYETVCYWQERYNAVHSAIYEEACSEQVVQMVDENAVALHRFILGKETVELPSGKITSVDSISDEAEFLISFIFGNKFSMLVTSPDGGNRDETLPFGTVAGRNAYIDIHILADELMTAGNSYADMICENINRTSDSSN